MRKKQSCQPRHWENMQPDASEVYPSKEQKAESTRKNNESFEG